jgi:hypothetical protein
MNKYSKIPITKSTEGKQMYINVKYPNIPLSDLDTYIICKSTDRYDKLAQTYYGDPSLWWIISLANNSTPQISLFPPLDVYVRIPQNYLEVVSAFNKLNRINPLLSEEAVIRSNNTGNTGNVGMGNTGNTGGGGY